MTSVRDQMLALVRRAHAHQSRNNGRVPYWTHLLAVAQIVEWALERAGDPVDATTREDLFLAALGHDLYEDTTVERRDIERSYGERVDAWIDGMTNRAGDHDRAAYLQHMASAVEEVRLLKLADLAENTASCSYAIHDMGVAWMERVFVPIATEMRALLHASTFDRYARTAALLRSHLDFHYERLLRNVEMSKLVVPRDPAP